MKDVQFGDSLDGRLSGECLRGAVLLSHGAGGTMDNSLLVNTAEELNALGFLTLRWNFGYVRPKRAPSRGGVREIPEMESAIDYLKEQAFGQPIILAGKSFGGRVSSYLGAGRRDIAGYVFYGLPIVGAGKNAKPRDWSHLAKLSGKILFVTGEKDNLCPLEKLAQEQEHLVVSFQSKVVPGDHSFKPRGEKDALRHCIEWVDANFK